MGGRGEGEADLPSIFHFAGKRCEENDPVKRKQLLTNSFQSFDAATSCQIENTKIEKDHSDDHGGY